MHIRFGKIDGFIRIYDGTADLTLFGSEKYEAFCNKVGYLISLKFGFIYVFSYYLGKISYPSVLNKDKNHYYYKIFLEKCWYQLAIN